MKMDPNAGNTPLYSYQSIPSPQKCQHSQESLPPLCFQQHSFCLNMPLGSHKAQFWHPLLHFDLEEGKNGKNKNEAKCGGHPVKLKMIVGEWV